MNWFKRGLENRWSLGDDQILQKTVKTETHVLLRMKEILYWIELWRLGLSYSIIFIWIFTAFKSQISAQKFQKNNIPYMWDSQPWGVSKQKVFGESLTLSYSKRQYLKGFLNLWITS